MTRMEVVVSVSVLYLTGILSVLAKSVRARSKGALDSSVAEKSSRRLDVEEETPFASLRLLAVQGLQHLTEDADDCASEKVPPVSNEDDFLVTILLDLDGAREDLLTDPFVKKYFELRQKEWMNQEYAAGGKVRFHDVTVDDVVDAEGRRRMRATGTCEKGVEECPPRFDVCFPECRHGSFRGDDDIKGKQLQRFLKSLQQGRLEATDLSYRVDTTVSDERVDNEVRFEEKIVDLGISDIEYISLISTDDEEENYVKDSKLCEGETCVAQKEAILAICDNLGIDIAQSGQTHECNWPGITCQNKLITGVWIDDHNRTVTKGFPNEFIELKHLTTLVLRNNAISGTLPTFLGDMRDLTILCLENNHLSNRIPKELGNLGQLMELRLKQNNFFGGLPSELGNAKSLTKIDISRNENLGGYIPGTLMNLSRLRTLRLYGCNINGKIPESFGSLSNLRSVLLGDNNLEDKIDMLFKLRNLEELDLANNELTGSNLDGLVTMSSLRVLNLYNNQFAGTCEFIRGLNSIQRLILGDNNFGGYILPSVGDLEYLEILDLGNNILVGYIPTEVGKLRHLKSVNLCKNNLIDVIPSEIGYLSNLENLLLSNNKLIGRIPSSLSNLQKVVTLDLGNNFLTGTVPSSVQNMNALKNMIIWGNDLVGNVHFFCHYHLFLFDIGKFDDTCGNLQKFAVSKVLSALQDNYYVQGHKSECDWPGVVCANSRVVVEINKANEWSSGSISTYIGVLSRLRKLDLSNNNLHGTVPKQVTRGTIEYLDLSGNVLLGGDLQFLCEHTFTFLRLDDMPSC